jgi:hypothetical protein
MNLKSVALFLVGGTALLCLCVSVSLVGLAWYGSTLPDVPAASNPTRRATFTPYPDNPDTPAILTINAYTFTQSLGTLDLDAGNTFLLLDVTVTNANLDELSYSVFDFTLTDGEGYQYLTSASPVEPALRSGNLSSGEKGRGFVVFELPAAANNLTLHFEPFEVDEQGEPLRLEVPIP